MKKIGILTCANTTNDLGCSMYFCLQAARDGTDSFAQYKGNSGAEIIGVMSCAGCPTAVSPERVLDRVRALADLGAEVIHFSTCVAALCPFKDQYEAVIREHYPKVKVVFGTHGGPGTPAETLKLMQTGVKGLLEQPRKGMVDLINEVKMMMNDEGKTKH